MLLSVMALDIFQTGVASLFVWALLLALDRLVYACFMY